MRWILLLCAAASAHAYEKLDGRYCVEYGPRDAKTLVVEYFSATCEQCVKLFAKEFKAEELGDVHVTLHPYPADLLTLQLMVCLGELDEAQKPLFLEAVLEALHTQKGAGGALILKTAMEALGKEMPDLDRIAFLETTQGWQDAYAFLVQEDVPRILPIVEIDGKLSKDLPNQALFNKLRTL